MYMELPQRPRAADRGTTNRVTLRSRPFFPSRHSKDSGMAMALGLKNHVYGLRFSLLVSACSHNVNFVYWVNIKY